MISPPPSPKFRTRSPRNLSPVPSPPEVAEPNPESFYQGLESSMDRFDFERFFATFPIESDVSKFFETFPLTQFHGVMVEILETVSFSEYGSPHGHPSRRARLVLEKELRILDGILNIMDGAALQVTDTRDELRRLKSEIQDLMGKEIPVEADSSNPVHSSVGDVDHGTVGSGSWETQVHNLPSSEAHGRYSTVPPSSVEHPTIPFSYMGYPTISPSYMGFPTIPLSSVTYPTIPPSSISSMPPPSMQSSQRPSGFHDTPTPSEHHSRNSTPIVPTRNRTDSLRSRPEDTQTFLSETYYAQDNPRNDSSSWRRR